jgi:hypothetical protein
LQALIDESSQFDGSVYIVNGDSHIYISDFPLAAGCRWLTTYGVTGSVAEDGDGLNGLFISGLRTTARNAWRATTSLPGHRELRDDRADVLPGPLGALRERPGTRPHLRHPR